MLRQLIQTIQSAYQPKRHRELLTALWREERWFDTPHQKKAAGIARDVLAAARLDDAHLAPFPADGRTLFQDWIAHMAWDCPSARLAVADGGDVLADRKECPQSVVYWSGPLAREVRAGELPRPEEVTGQVIDGDALPALAPQTVNGKFILTAKLAADFKRDLVSAGKDPFSKKPLAIVSDFLGKGRGYTEETTKWCNRWSDGPDNWYYHAGDVSLAGFCLSPAAGKRLRAALAANPRLELTGHCQSRLYEGTAQCVTAVLPGIDPAREIWLYGHACEQGAHDNCAGVAVIVEAVRMLKELVLAGKLPPPRYSIRVITTEECIGMAAFASLHTDLVRRALAGLNVDGAGGPSSEEVPFGLSYGPLSAPSIGWAAAALIGRILDQQSGGAYLVRPRRAVPTADDMIADPNCGPSTSSGPPFDKLGAAPSVSRGGVPSLWLGQGGNCWAYHSSSDTPEICRDESLAGNAVLAAAWAYLLAALDERSAAAILPDSAAWLDSDIIRPPSDDPIKRDSAELSRWTAGGIIRDVGRWGIAPAVYEPFAVKYAAAGAPPLADLPTQGQRYMRRAWGTYTFERLPVSQRKFSRWSEWAAAALYWNDGLRPLAAIERLVAAETGRTVKLQGYFDACVDAGLMVQDNSGAFKKH